MLVDHPLFEIKRSPIHNLGVFATLQIKKGTHIIEYIGEKITKTESERRNDAWSKIAKEKNLGAVYIFELNKRYDLDGNVEYNTAKHINHSCDPNCEAVNSRGHIWIVAIKNIQVGEELSFNYGYNIEHFMDHPCNCGVKYCVGYIVREDQRKKLKRLLVKSPSRL